jgi:hypothetical protein
VLLMPLAFEARGRGVACIALRRFASGADPVL